MVFVAACASAAPAGQAASQAAGSGAAPAYEDARSQASDADIRDARRAYRSACEQHQSTAYCECMTGGMAQMLPPTDLAVATAAFTGASVSAPAQARARVAQAQSSAEGACVQFRES
jgi:hypothetical protein